MSAHVVHRCDLCGNDYSRKEIADACRYNHYAMKDFFWQGYHKRGWIDTEIY